MTGQAPSPEDRSSQRQRRQTDGQRRDLAVPETRQGAHRKPQWRQDRQETGRQPNPPQPQMAPLRIEERGLNGGPEGLAHRNFVNRRRLQQELRRRGRQENHGSQGNQPHGPGRHRQAGIPCCGGHPPASYRWPQHQQVEYHPSHHGEKAGQHQPADGGLRRRLQQRLVRQSGGGPGDGLAYRKHV